MKKMAEKIINVQEGDVLWMKNMEAAKSLADRMDELRIHVFIFVGNDPIEINKLDDETLKRAGLKRIEEDGCN